MEHLDIIFEIVLNLITRIELMCQAEGALEATALPAIVALLQSLTEIAHLPTQVETLGRRTGNFDPLPKARKRLGNREIAAVVPHPLIATNILRVEGVERRLRIRRISTTSRSESATSTGTADVQ